MAEDLKITSSESKEVKYQVIFPQIEALLSGEDDLIANLGNIAAALKEQFQWFWVGFYLVKNEELVLGPFQGPVACTRIKKGQGVCGASWEREEILIVQDVNAFPGHIACSAASQSEIVLPVFQNGKIIGVMDVDSEYLSHFDDMDALYLNKIIKLIDA